MACNPECQRPCCNASVKECGCQIHEICAVCNAEVYEREIKKRATENFRRQQHPIRQTHTYATLEVNPATFHDIQRRLEAAGVADEYIRDGKIIFGPVALHT